MNLRAKIISACAVGAFIGVVNGHYTAEGVRYEQMMKPQHDAFAHVVSLRCEGTTLRYEWLDVTGHDHVDTLRHARSCRSGREAGSP